MQLIDPKSIIVPEGRQRQEFKEADIDSLLSSMRVLAKERDLHFGQLQPIVVMQDLTLLAGERRLRAMLKGGAPFIKAVFSEELTPAERQEIEFEENAKRVDLTWQENCLAILKYHDFQSGLNEAWTLEDTARRLSLTSAGYVSRCVQVAREVKLGDERIISAGGINAAYNILERRRDRAIETELSQMDDLFDGGKPATKPAKVPQGQTPKVPVAQVTGFVSIEDLAQSVEPTLDNLELGIEADIVAEIASEAEPAAPEDPIQCADFIEWLKEYEGRRFNFLHCDFPYGVGHHDTEQGGSNEWGSYLDTPEVYWALCNALTENLDKILFPSAHVVFWFSMNYYAETLEFFKNRTNLEVQPFPIIWHKSDGKGIAPDVQRQPRRIYETALIMSRGDRKILKCKNNLYACPTSKELHISEKPEPMLRHFFEMFVDNLTEMLDPTCGSGGALRAAEALGATRVVGLELNPEYAETARTQLRIARNKARLSELV